MAGVWVFAETVDGTPKPVVLELRRRLLSAFGDAPFLRDGLPGSAEGNIFEG